MSDIAPGLAVVLRGIGIEQPDWNDELHRKLATALAELGPGATLGQRVVAMRWIFGWEHKEAGEVFARSKADYEHAVARRVTEEMAKGQVDGRRMSLGWAQAIAEDAAYEHKLAYLLAEQRERSMRKFLDTLDAALDNHRTDRADLRAGDRASAQGYGGGA